MIHSFLYKPYIGELNRTILKPPISCIFFKIRTPCNSFGDHGWMSYRLIAFTNQWVYLLPATWRDVIGFWISQYQYQLKLCIPLFSKKPRNLSFYMQLTATDFTKKIRGYFLYILIMMLVKSSSSRPGLFFPWSHWGVRIVSLLNQGEALIFQLYNKNRFLPSHYLFYYYIFGYRSQEIP